MVTQWFIEWQAGKDLQEQQLQQPLVGSFQLKFQHRGHQIPQHLQQGKKDTSSIKAEQVLSTGPGSVKQGSDEELLSPLCRTGTGTVCWSHIRNEYISLCIGTGWFLRPLPTQIVLWFRSQSTWTYREHVNILHLYLLGLSSVRFRKRFWYFA